MALPRNRFPVQGTDNPQQVGNPQQAGNEQPLLAPREGKRVPPITVNNTMGGSRKVAITQLVEKQTVEAAIRTAGWDPAGFEIQLNSRPTQLTSTVKPGDTITMLEQATGNEPR